MASPDTPPSLRDRAAKHPRFERPAAATARPQAVASWSWSFSANRISTWLLLCATVLVIHHLGFVRVGFNVGTTLSVPACFSPTTHVPHPTYTDIEGALLSVDKYLRTLSNRRDLDSIVAAVVTADGALYEATYGSLRANESDPALRGTVDRNSVYRLASISKLFAAYETYVLRDRGKLHWDDRVNQFLPSFKWNTTIRELATHLSGIGGDLPPGDMAVWPHGLDGSGPPPDNGLPFPTEDATIDAVNKRPLVTAPRSFPIYSNTACGILGLVNAAADGGVDGQYPLLLRNDLFARLNMTSSMFKPTPELRARVAVASIASDEADYDFLNAMSSSGGQMSSLADLIRSQQSLLDPARYGVLQASSVREWMQPQFVFPDDLSEVGHVWEIYKRKDTFGRTYRLYTKVGVLNGYHSVYSINPDYGYGVIVLSTGRYGDVHNIGWDIVSTIQPAIDAYRTTRLEDRHSGTYVSEDGQSRASISVKKGGLYATQYVLDGIDVLSGLSDASPEPRALWPVDDEGASFRLSFGVPGLNGRPNYGCILDMVGLDPGYSRGHAIGLIEFAVLNGTRCLTVPATGAVLLLQK